MKKIYYLLIMLAILTAQAFGETLTGRVVKVTDGDTFHVLMNGRKNYKIRMLGIDAPEKSQAYGNQSKQYLASMIAGRTVTVQYENEDRYGRILGTISTSGIRDVNLEMIRAGYAWYYRLGNHIPTYERAEAQAHEQKKGLWKDPNALNPYTYRKMEKNRRKKF